MRAAAARWTPAQRRVIDATKATLGVGKPNPKLPRTIEGFLDRLQQAVTDPHVRLALVSSLAGPAKAGVTSISGRLSVFDAGMFAAVEHMDLAIVNAQHQARSDPDGRELVEHRQSLKHDLDEAAKAVRDKIAKGE
ncbi:MAG: hypothetical protein ACAI38_24720 [Myxococcota bacterium]|nr:hypothetical protein [Myxococcota bacterium]